MSATLGRSVTGVTSEHPACHLLLGAGWPGTQSRGVKGCVGTYGCFFQAVQQMVVLAFD